MPSHGQRFALAAESVIEPPPSLTLIGLAFGLVFLIAVSVRAMAVTHFTRLLLTDKITVSYRRLSMDRFGCYRR